MRVHVLSSWGKARNARLVEHFSLFATSLINSIIQEHKC